MLVYVATSSKIENAFNQWIKDNESDDNKIIYQVYSWFMRTEAGKQFYTPSGLVCFSLEDWVSAFEQWVSKEIAAHQKNADNIRKWSDYLIRLLSSDWGIERKLIVAECLDDDDYQQ
jgi:hypothetical protein